MCWCKPATLQLRYEDTYMPSRFMHGVVRECCLLLSLTRLYRYRSFHPWNIQKWPKCTQAFCVCKLSYISKKYKTQCIQATSPECHPTQCGFFIATLLRLFCLHSTSWHLCFFYAKPTNATFPQSTSSHVRRAGCSGWFRDVVFKATGATARLQVVRSSNSRDLCSLRCRRRR